ncbi:hypothetical protein Q2V60_06430, partial [Escherichia coli]|uniref:hypothetical protein n=1 Tax=Escherichia coli TaxID=562 RepID=UPI002665D2C5
WKGWAILLRQKQKKLIMLPSETMIWQPEFTDKTLSRKPGAVHSAHFQKRHALVHRILRKSRKTLSDASQVLCASIQSHCVGSKYRVVGSVLVQ